MHCFESASTRTGHHAVVRYGLTLDGSIPVLTRLRPLLAAAFHPAVVTASMLAPSA
jgi:hypothetical protein